MDYNLLMSNSLNLPFFMHLPARLPDYQAAQVSEWWTLPRRAAQGAQFLIYAAETDAPLICKNDILFIMPAPHWVGNCVMLARLRKKYLVRRIIIENNKLKWEKDDGKQTAIPAQAEAVGIVVERLTGTIF